MFLRWWSDGVTPGSSAATPPACALPPLAPRGAPLKKALRSEQRDFIGRHFETDTCKTGPGKGKYFSKQELPPFVLLKGLPVRLRLSSLVNLHGFWKGSVSTLVCILETICISSNIPSKFESIQFPCGLTFLLSTSPLSVHFWNPIVPRVPLWHVQSALVFEAPLSIDSLRHELRGASVWPISRSNKDEEGLGENVLQVVRAWRDCLSADCLFWTNTSNYCPFECITAFDSVAAAPQLQLLLQLILRPLRECLKKKGQNSENCDAFLRFVSTRNHLLSHRPGLKSLLACLCCCKLTTEPFNFSLKIFSDQRDLKIEWIQWMMLWKRTASKALRRSLAAHTFLHSSGTSAIKRTSMSMGTWAVAARAVWFIRDRVCVDIGFSIWHLGAHWEDTGTVQRAKSQEFHCF